MIFDATKVTYNTYSCAISCMSRESIKMDGRDSAECQKWEKKDINVIIKMLMNETKGKYCLLLQKGEDQNVRGGGNWQ